MRCGGGKGVELGGEFSRQMGAEGTVEVVEARCGVGVYCDGHSGCEKLWGGGEGRLGCPGLPLLGLGGERGEGF